MFDIYFDILAAGVGTAILVLDADADAIVFGGGLSKFEILIEEFTKRLPEHLLNDVQLPIVVKAKFSGARGVALLNYKKTVVIFYPCCFCKISRVISIF